MTAVFHRLAPNVRVIGVDHLPELVELGRQNMAKDGIDVDDPQTKVDIVEGDGQQGVSFLQILPKSSRSLQIRSGAIWSVPRLPSPSSFY